jgi:large-conductance mechanosensitive channel
VAINIPIISSLEGKGFEKAILQIKALETTSQKAGAIASKAFLPAVAAMGALTVAAGYAIKNAIADEAAQAQLARTLVNVTNATNDQIAAVEKQIDKMQMATGVTDDQLRPAFASLLRGTNNVAMATDALSLAMDISAGTGQDLAGVSDALAKAYGGNFKALKQLSPEIYGMIKDGASLDDVMAALAGTFGGSAATAAGTAQGQFKRLNVALDEAKESIGKALLPAITAVLPYLITFGDWAADHTGILLGVGTAIAAISTALIAFKAAQIIANTVTVVTTALNWSLAASAAAANTALTLGVGAAAIAAGLVVAAGAFLVYKNATKSATEETGNFKEQLGPMLGPELTNTFDKVTKTGGAVDDMAAKIKKASDALKTYMVAALESAQSALEDAQGAFNGFATSVSDGLKDAFSFKDAKDAGDETGTGFLSGLRAQVAGIQTYSKDVSTLLTLGLSQEALQAVLDAGGESGAAIAAELIKGGSKAILETNALVESSKVAAAIIGQQAAQQWYGAGVSNAQSYLQGVEAAFAEAQKRLAKKGLKIADIKGISASFSESLAGPSVTPINMSPSQGGGVPGGGSVVVNVNGGISTSAEIGKSVVDAINQYTQVYGPVNFASF